MRSVSCPVESETINRTLFSLLLNGLEQFTATQHGIAFTIDKPFHCFHFIDVHCWRHHSQPWDSPAAYSWPNSSYMYGSDPDYWECSAPHKYEGRDELGCLVAGFLADSRVVFKWTNFVRFYLHIFISNCLVNSILANEALGGRTTQLVLCCSWPLLVHCVPLTHNLVEIIKYWY